MYKKNSISQNKEELRFEINRLYWDEKYSTPEIAKRLGISYGTMNYLMKKLNIPRRTSSEAHKIEWANPENRKRKIKSLKGIHLGQIPWNKGLTKKTDKRVKSAWNKGLTKKIDERVKKTSLKISKANKDFWSKPENREMYLKIRKGTHPSGVNHPNWQNGKSFEPYGIEFNEKLREEIRDRDYHVCQLCKDFEDGSALNVHHVDYNKENNSPENLISLCVSCNARVNYHRDFWQDHFQNIMKERGIQ